jgi:hypothetical protein
MNNKLSKDETYSDEETARRRDEALLRALSTPPKHHSEMKLGKRKEKPASDESPKKRGRPKNMSSAKSTSQMPMIVAAIEIAAIMSAMVALVFAFSAAAAARSAQHAQRP